ncbi:MAG TPA: hypothetical protein VFH95_14570 [Candidatus Kapabacteria bacterium]|nr:hypothetical protein [Candidatus Kapabacteria bacterium]
MFRIATRILKISVLALLVGVFHSANARAQGGHYASSYLPPAVPNGIPQPLPFIVHEITPPTGLIIEMSVAPPLDVPTDPYQLGKYGRVSVDYTGVATFEGSDIGVAAQALHVAHHLLFYSAGVSSDINNDGMFLFTVGLAHYQTGNSRAEPFVDAPFIRLRFQSSQKSIYGYSEIETTMHFRSYISGMIGFGIRLSPMVRLIGGLHHTEFVMPTEHLVQQVNGLEGIISWGM